MPLKPPGEETGVLCVREVSIKTGTCSYPGPSIPLHLPVHTTLTVVWGGRIGGSRSWNGAPVRAPHHQKMPVFPGVPCVTFPPGDGCVGDFPGLKSIQGVFHFSRNGNPSGRIKESSLREPVFAGTACKLAKNTAPPSAVYRGVIMRQRVCTSSSLVSVM